MCGEGWPGRIFLVWGKAVGRDERYFSGTEISELIEAAGLQVKDAGIIRRFPSVMLVVVEKPATR